MNKVILKGRLTKDPDVRFTSGERQMPVARFSVAVDRCGKDKGADFINCVSFDKQAELIERYFKKGSAIILEGHIQTGSYDGKNGKVYTTDVITERIEFCESKNAEEKPNRSEGFGSFGTDSFMSVPDTESDSLPFT